MQEMGIFRSIVLKFHPSFQNFVLQVCSHACFRFAPLSMVCFLLAVTIMSTVQEALAPVLGHKVLQDATLGRFMATMRPHHET